MSEEKIEPLDPRLVSLLRSHAPPLRAPEDALERVATRLAVRVPAMMGGGPAAGPAGPGTLEHGDLARIAGTTFSALGRKAIVPLAVAFAVGGGAGAAVMHAAQRPVERLVYVDRSAPPPAPVARAEESTPKAVPVEDLPLATREPPRLKPSPAASAVASSDVVGDSIQGERRLLDEARDALRRGDPEACLEAANRHRARHPSGALAEEREALAISALASMGRAVDARQRAALFVDRYPTSLFRPVVDAVASGVQGSP